MTTVTADDRPAWREARILADLGELTAQWLEGRIASVPGCYGPPDIEDPALIPLLAALNRAGFVTTASQAGTSGPGSGGARWQQRAAVEAFTADPGLIQRIRQGIRDYGLYVVVHDPFTMPRRAAYRGMELPVTLRDGEECAWFGRQLSRRDIRSWRAGWGVCRRSARDALCNAWQVTVIDTEWGRPDVLWRVLERASARTPGGLRVLGRKP